MQAMADAEAGPMLEVVIAAELSRRACLGVLVIRGVTVRAEDADLAAEVETRCGELRARYGQLKSAEVPGAADARTLYKDLGLDPTKTRPSSEALLRRVLKGEALYRINTLVDAMNLASLSAQLPFGLYDLARVKPPVTLRRGRPGEAYEGIRKGDVHVEGRPVLADGEGPFGNPTSDSARTMVTLATRDALVTVYAPSGFPRPRLEQVLRDTEDTLVRFCGGTAAERRILA
jgi:DNA/RNA-binding domain of Phe-tRNA-synthetase-like protein